MYFPSKGIFLPFSPCKGLRSHGTVAWISLSRHFSIGFHFSKVLLAVGFKWVSAQALLFYIPSQGAEIPFPKSQSCYIKDFPLGDFSSTEI